LVRGEQIRGITKRGTIGQHENDEFV